MKKLSTLFVLFLFAFAVNAQNTDNDKAIKYNDDVVGLQNKLVEGILVFTSIIGGENVTKDEATFLLADLGKTSEKIIKDLEKLGTFKDDTAFYKSALELFKFYNRIIANEFKQMIAILFKPELTKQDMADLQQIQLKISEEEKVLDEKFNTKQTAFAKKYNFTLGENELQKELDN